MRSPLSTATRLSRPFSHASRQSVKSSKSPIPFIGSKRLRPGITITTSIMTTITIRSPAEVEVTLPQGLTEKKLLAFSPFNNWLKTLSHSLALQHSNPSHPFHPDPYALRSIAIQSYDLFGSGSGSRLGFLKLTADVPNAAGEKLPGSVFLRGPSVAMLIMLIPDDAPQRQSPKAKAGGEHVGTAVDEKEEERYVLLTVQPRIPAGSLAFAELPAGMVDEGGSFAGTAAREIKEELGLEIPASELRCLSEMAAAATTTTTTTRQEGGVGGGEKEEGEEDDEAEALPHAMYPSAGGCDEHIPIYMHERRVPRAQLGEWTGRLTGLRDHGEKITLKLVRMRDLWREGGRDAKALAAVALWEGFRRESRL